MIHQTIFRTDNDRRAAAADRNRGGVSPLPEYIDAYLELTRTLDTAASRYLAIYYKKPQMVRELTDLDYRLVEMDRYGVAMHLLSITGPGVQAFDAARGTELAGIANDMLAAAISRHPTRFAGLAAVAPQDPAAAAREIDRAVGVARAQWGHH